MSYLYYEFMTANIIVKWRGNNIAEKEVIQAERALPKRRCGFYITSLTFKK
jgi:hypothetical protein